MKTLTLALCSLFFFVAICPAAAPPPRPKAITLDHDKLIRVVKDEKIIVKLPYYPGQGETWLYVGTFKKNKGKVGPPKPGPRPVYMKLVKTTTDNDGLLGGKEIKFWTFQARETGEFSMIFVKKKLRKTIQDKTFKVSVKEPSPEPEEDELVEDG